MNVLLILVTYTSRLYSRLYQDCDRINMKCNKKTHRMDSKIN